MVFPEPITAISTAAGLLGFIITTLLSTIEKGRLAYEFLEDYERRVNRYHIILRDNELKLRSWADKWEPGGPRSASGVDRAIELWGPEGLQEVNNIKAQLRHVGETVRRRVYGAIEQQPSWHAVLNRVNNTTGQTSTYSSFALPNEAGHDRGENNSHVRAMCRRAAFVLFSDASLKLTINEVKDLATSLESTATNLVYTRHGRQWAGTSLTALTLTEIAQANPRRRVVTQALRQAWEHLNGRNAHPMWTLVSEDLLIPGSSLESLSVAYLRVEHLFERDGSAQWVDSSIDLDTSESSAYHVSILDRARQLGAHGHVATLQHSIRELFLLLANVPQEFLFLMDDGLTVEDLKEQFANVLRLRRVKTACCLASSVALFGDTPWMQSLCSCSVRHAQMARPPDDVSDLYYIEAIVAVHHHAGLTPLRCYHTGISGNVYLSLALVLVELALARPIQLEHDHNNALVYYVVDAANRRLVTAADLVRETRSCTKSQLYQEAVEYCFLLAGGLLDPAHSPERRAERFEHEVVRKLNSSYDACAKANLRFPWLQEERDSWERRYEAYIATAQSALPR